MILIIFSFPFLFYVLFNFIFVVLAAAVPDVHDELRLRDVARPVRRSYPQVKLVVGPRGRGGREAAGDRRVRVEVDAAGGGVEPEPVGGLAEELEGDLVAEVGVGDAHAVAEGDADGAASVEVCAAHAALVDVAVEGGAVVVLVGDLDDDLDDLAVAAQLDDAGAALAQDDRVLGGGLAVEADLKFITRTMYIVLA